MLWRLSCGPLDVPGTTFLDMEADDWFATAVDWGVATETVRGYPDGTFRPYAEITRAEFATMAWRIYDCQTATAVSTFPDVEFRSFYGDAVDWMVEIGVTTGTGDGEFGSGSPVTRGELATFLSRLPLG